MLRATAHSPQVGGGTEREASAGLSRHLASDCPQGLVPTVLAWGPHFFMPVLLSGSQLTVNLVIGIIGSSSVISVISTIRIISSSASSVSAVW
jgi:hypothetical protein